MIYMFLSITLRRGDINSSNLPCLSSTRLELSCTGGCPAGIICELIFHWFPNNFGLKPTGVYALNVFQPLKKFKQIKTYAR